MRTFSGKRGTQIHHHGDYSGEARISIAGGPEIQVPCADLLDFVAEYVRDARIAAAESAKTADLLGVK